METYSKYSKYLMDGTTLVDSGAKGLFGIYNAKSKLIQQWRIAMQSGNIYRVYQYDFKGFFFASKA